MFHRSLNAGSSSSSSIRHINDKRFKCTSNPLATLHIPKQLILKVLVTYFMKMKHEQPKVEDYESETNNPPITEKRKRGSKNKEQILDTEQPPTKVSKSDNDEYQEDELLELNDEGLGEEEEDEEEYEDGEDEQEYDDGDEGEEENEVEDEGEGEENRISMDELKAHKIVEEFGRVPLEGTSFAKEPLEASPETVLAIAIDAMIKSRPISHELSQKTVNKILEAGYHDIQKLAKSSWEERTMVLKDGGYNRYREQGATNLGNLAELVEGKYGEYPQSKLKR